jgi:hypothetical protein
MQLHSSYQEIKERAKHCVCRQCGGKLEVRQIVFNQYGGAGMELYCPHCQRIEFGTEPEIFQLAKEYIEDNDFNYFLDMPEDARNKALNISKMCEIYSWLFRRLGVYEPSGFNETAAALLKDQHKEK